MASNSRNVRALLPAPQSVMPSAGSDTRAAIFDQSPILPPRKRGKQVDLACDACKKRKSKCDGRRPHCTACERKTTECYYDEEAREANKVAGLKRQNNVLEEELHEAQALLSHLKQSFETEAQRALAALRAGAELCDIIHISPVATKPSDTAWQVQSGSARSQQESFRSDRSETDAIIQDRIPSRFDVYRMARQAGLLETVSSDGVLGVDQVTISFDVAHPADLSKFERNLPQVRSPNFVPEYGAAAPMLSQKLPPKPFLELKAHPWTTVTNDDVFFSHIICLWLCHHAHCLSYIYPTMFLEGLQTGVPNKHCSRMLVNSVLAIGCQYSPDLAASGPPDQPALRGHDFYCEAYDLWQAEEGRPSVTSTQALIAMYEFNKLRGKDRFGWVLLHSAIEMGFDLGLFKDPSLDLDMTDDVKFARAFTAWSIYNYQAVESVIFCKLPRIRRCRASKPDGPFIPSGLTEKWQPYNITEGVSRESYFWDHWNAFCTLSDILVDTACMLFADEADGLHTLDSMMVYQSADLMTRVMMWHARLPSSLSLNTNEMPHNLWLHMTFYMLTITLHRPLLPHPGGSAITDSALRENAKYNMIDASQSIVRLAAIALEHFGHNYRNGYDAQICAAAAFTLVHDIQNEQSRQLLLGSVAILHAQASRFLLAGALARSILLAAQSLAHSNSDVLRDISTALEHNMSFDYLTLNEMTPAQSKQARQVDTSLARFVSSRFPSKISTVQGMGFAVATSGHKLDEVLNQFHNLQLDGRD